MNINSQFKVGDFCSRDGTDVHEVMEIDTGEDFMLVRCVVAPLGKWCAVGDTEWNLTRRYDKVIYEPKRSEGKANDRTDRH